MKEGKIIPKWPLYTADAIMFAAVFAMLFPSIRDSSPISFGMAFLCSLLVLCGMFMCLLPYWLEVMEKKSERMERASQNEENFRIVFDELSALRMMLTELEERFEAISNGNESISSLEKGMLELRDSVKNKISEISSGLSNAVQTADSCALADREIRQTLEDIGADIVVLKELFSSSSENLSDEISQLRKRADKCESAFDAVSKRMETHGEKIAKLENQTAEGRDTPDLSNSRQTSKLGAMMGRALSGAAQTRMSVEKFVELSKPDLPGDEGDLKEPAPTGSSPDCETKPEENTRNASPAAASGSENGESANEIPSPESTAVESPVEDLDNGEESARKAAAPSDFEEGEKVRGEDGALLDNPLPSGEDIPGDDFSDSEEDSLESIGGSEKSDFFEEADSAILVSESADRKLEKSVESDMLFDLPTNHEKGFKPRKGDAVVTVNALIGIGNKPYLRGNGAGLRQDKGLPMEYVEIGKWRYVFPPFKGDIIFSVYKNDKIQSDGNENFSISPGEKLEKDLSFTSEEE